MGKLKAGIIVFPATNCEVDTKRACEFFGWKTEYIWHSEEIKNVYDVIFLPGGFSYGDYISAGRIAKFSKSVETLPIGESMIVGICNGFQILCEKGLLEGALTDNKNLKFLSESAKLNFLGEDIVLPIAHQQGNFQYNQQTPNSGSIPVLSVSTKRHRRKSGFPFQPLLTDASPRGHQCYTNYVPLKHYTAESMPESGAFLTYKENKNGSDFDIAGLYDKEKRILGMMPHPERAVFKETGSVDGRKIFEFIEKEC